MNRCRKPHSMSHDPLFRGTAIQIISFLSPSRCQYDTTIQCGNQPRLGVTTDHGHQPSLHLPPPKSNLGNRNERELEGIAVVRKRIGYDSENCDHKAGLASTTHIRSKEVANSALGVTFRLTMQIFVKTLTGEVLGVAA